MLRIKSEFWERKIWLSHFIWPWPQSSEDHCLFLATDETPLLLKEPGGRRMGGATAWGPGGLFLRKNAPNSSKALRSSTRSLILPEWSVFGGGGGWIYSWGGKKQKSWRRSCHLSRELSGGKFSSSLLLFICLFVAAWSVTCCETQLWGDMFKKTKSKVLVDYASEEDDMSWHHHHSYKVKNKSLRSGSRTTRPSNIQRVWTQICVHFGHKNTRFHLNGGDDEQERMSKCQQLCHPVK